MDLFSLSFLALALSMDAFAVSVSLGLSTKKLQIRQAFLVAFSCGLFQGFMPILGFWTSIVFKDLINAFDHWIAFFLLFFIGAKMLYEVIPDKKDATASNKVTFSFKKLLILSFATSIDALAAGISLAVLDADIYVSALLISAVTFTLSLAGVYFGKKIGSLFYNKAQVFGGIILISIGIKILFEHLFH